MPPKRSADKGGVRQREKKRKKLEEDVVAETIARSILAHKLVELVMWGSIPANLCQHIAQWAVEDGITHPEVMLLSRLGTGGRHESNIYVNYFNELLK